jgi:hypothetical protein
MITENRVQQLVLGLLKQQSDRDKQKLIGASDFSNPCDLHLSYKLRRVSGGPSKYWLGAKLGTAIHGLIEDAIDVADIREFPELKSVAVEQSIILGELKDYGIIKSKPDLALIDNEHLIDWKTTTRAKSKKMQNVIHGLSNDTDTTYTLRKYYAQAQIYAWGLNNSGVNIDACSLVFINRDGTSDSDVWNYTFEYQESVAVSLWERLERIWLDVKDGLTEFNSDPGCYECRMAE